MKLGDKVKFKHSDIWDDKIHTILSVQRTHGDMCYFLHYWSWIDEDELVLVEDKQMETFKKGDTVKYKNQEEWGDAIHTVDYQVGDSTYYVEGGFDETINLALDVVNDAVNPTHYNGTEVLDQMVLIYGLEAVKGFCICNAFKYRQRAGKKSKSIEEDIKKALWYENKYKEL